MIEKTILSHLIFNEAFARKTLPFLKEEYFQTQHDKTIYNLINEYVNKYNSTPTKEVLFLELNNKDGMSEASSELDVTINQILFKVKDKLGLAESLDTSS